MGFLQGVKRLWMEVPLTEVTGFPLQQMEIVVWETWHGGVVRTYALCVDPAREGDGTEARVRVIAKRGFGRTLRYDRTPEKGLLVLDCWGLSQDFRYTLRQQLGATRIQRAWRRAIADPSYVACRDRLCREISELESLSCLIQ